MRTVFVLALLLLCLPLVGCKGESGRSSVNGKIRAVSTVGMLNDAVRIVGGDRVEAVSLMGPGVDPHLYRATAGDVKKLTDAQIVFFIGLELEGRMSEIFEKMSSSKPTVAVGEAVPSEKLRRPKEFEGKFDPHVWFDVQLWRHVVERVRDELVKLDPASKEQFEKNATEYLASLDALDKEVEETLAAVPQEQRVLITAHDAFGYFGVRYGFEVVGIQGTSTATEASAGTVRELAQLIASRKIKAIFVESSVPQGTIEALRAAVKSRGWDVKIGGQLFSDAMGNDGTPEGTYVGMVRHNARTIAEALK